MNIKLTSILEDIKLQLLIHSKYGMVIGDWIPEKTAKRFFDYGETQFREMAKKENLMSSKIGRRKFYSKRSIIELLDRNKEN